jgi:hypothetical protein
MSVVVFFITTKHNPEARKATKEDASGHLLYISVVFETPVTASFL